MKQSAYFTIEQIYTQLVVRLVYKSTNIIDHSSGLLHFGASILILKTAWEPSCTQYFIQPRNVNKHLYLVVSLSSFPLPPRSNSSPSTRPGEYRPSLRWVTPTFKAWTATAEVCTQPSPSPATSPRWRRGVPESPLFFPFNPPPRSPGYK